MRRRCGSTRRSGYPARDGTIPGGPATGRAVTGRGHDPPLTGGSTATSSPGPSTVASPATGSSPLTHTRAVPSTASNSGP
jgi:hypothetical protein